LLIGSAVGEKGEKDETGDRAWRRVALTK
jgi:hypothetical protein